MPAPLQIYQGHALALLAALDPGLAQCCVTSPPYWGLRDYGTAPVDWPEVSYSPMPGLPSVTIPAMKASLGLESTIEEFIGHQILIFREVARVLKPDGTAWVNMGDCHTSDAGGYDLAGSRGESSSPRLSRKTQSAILKARLPKRPHGLAPKNLLGQPWRLAFALQADGWILRSDVIWQKPNALPESVRDRPTKSHEYLFLLARRRRYYWDRAAFTEPVTGNSHPRGKGDNPKSYHGSIPGREAGPGQDRRSLRSRAHTQFATSISGLVDRRNRRTVWTVPNSPYHGTHCATFPAALIRPCITASTRPGDIVLDPFAGTGTTGQVALALDRHAILCELSTDYIPQIHHRCSTGASVPAQA